MKVKDIVSFHSENFFEGAVQLNWASKRPDKSKQAANAFVFHGPRYHGATDADNDGIVGGYKLKDSASFVSELLKSINGGLEEKEHNPYWLVVAGYGSGKSHLALTCTSLLANPQGATSQKIVSNIIQADELIGEKVQKGLEQLGRPILTLTLDGMSGFHLGNALTQAALDQLKLNNIDTGAIHALSPRFQFAEQFVERNYAFREVRFKEALPEMGMKEICHQLENNNEDIYSIVDALYSEANGSPIPVMGQESAQELLNTLCDVYCGEEGFFSSVVILFDEFGRYLEYAAEKPLLAGDAALQQIFQGVQDNSHKIRFIGFIQYELKAYLKRFGSADLRQLQRYITRFDSSQKWYLSSNLETLFAHMIGKNQPLLTQVWGETNGQVQGEESWQLMNMALPGFDRFPVWSNQEKFTRVIAQGCWPLHPLTTWFLTRQKDIVQSRSALTFIKEIIEDISSEDVITENRLRQVSAAELVLKSMLPEIIAAERETGSMVAETLQFLLEKFQAHLTREQRFILASVAILEKMRVSRLDQDNMNRLLSEASALPLIQVNHALAGLSKELGAIEWNRDLGQYELISDASTRGQFQQWIRKEQASLTSRAIQDLFVQRASIDTELENIRPDFANYHKISTSDWQFQAHFAHSRILKEVVKRAFDDWEQATLPTEPKGSIIYLYIHPEEDMILLEAQITEILQDNLNNTGFTKAPIWVVGLEDRSGKMSEHIGRVYLFETKISVENKERFRRFIPEEKERSQSAIKDAIRESVKQRLFWIAGFSDIPADRRLKQIGNSIFNKIYPQALPFPFDGFASSSGTGAGDCTHLIRSLISKKVDMAWIQLEQKRRQNRINEVLVKSWGVLRRTGKVSLPKNEKIHTIYQQLVENHENNIAESLLKSYQLLLAPPYGMNASSAGLMLGLLLGLENPSRRIIYQGEMILSGDWITKVFPKTKGKYFFDQLILEKTTLRFLSENSESRWRNLLDKWEVAKKYDDILQLSNEVEKTRQMESLPESMEGLYVALRARADEVKDQVNKLEQQFEEWERSLERAERNAKVDTLLTVGGKLIKKKNFFQEEKYWPTNLVNSCDTLIKIVQELVSRLISTWIPRQGCNNVEQVSLFQKQMEHAVRNLQALSFELEARRLEDSARSSISKVKARQQYNLTLDRSDDYPRQPKPTSSIPIRELRDELTIGDNLIKSVHEARSALSQEEINSRIQAIEAYQGHLREAISKHTNALGEIFSTSITTYGELDEILKQVKGWQVIFDGTRDAPEVKDIIIQLECIESDVSVWKHNDVSVERLEELIKYQLEQQLIKINQYFDEHEIDPIWDIEELYNKLANEKIKNARQRSSDWISSHLSCLPNLSQLDKDQCVNLENELSNSPSYLSKVDKDKVTQTLQAIKAQKTTQIETQRKKIVSTWLDKFHDLPNIKNLTKLEIEQYLKIIRNPPSEARPDELTSLKSIEEIFTTQLDTISIDEIIMRIKRLPLDIQHKILLILSENLD